MHVQHFKSHEFTCLIFQVKNLNAERHNVWMTWNSAFNNCFRFRKIICFAFLTRFSSIIFRDFFSSFSISFSCLRVCKMRSSKSFFMFFYKELWSSSTIIIFFKLYFVFNTIWWISWTILRLTINVYNKIILSSSFE